METAPKKLYTKPTMAKLVLPQLKRENIVGKGRHYQLPDWLGAHKAKDWVPSVTNVQGVLDRPPLTWWAVNVEREMVIKHASMVQARGLSPSGFILQLRASLPWQQARFKKSKEGADIGAETHSLIQWECRRRLGEVEPRPKPSDGAELAFMAWLDWAISVNFKPILVEQSVWSEHMFSAGTLDCYGEQDWPEPGIRRRFVYDWKSNKTSKSQPNGIYPESHVQVSTYTQMLVELGGAPESTMACVVRLPKSLEDPVFKTDGVVDHIEIMPETRRKLAEGFTHIRKVWSFMKNEVGK